VKVACCIHKYQSDANSDVLFYEYYLQVIFAFAASKYSIASDKKLKIKHTNMPRELKHNALSILNTLTLAVAGTAPSYSLTATTATLTAAVSLAAPAALLYGAIPMFGISFAFMYLNRWRADAGTAYAWVGRSLNPMLGFLAAWTFLVLSTVFMVAAALPIGVATLDLIAPQLRGNVVLATAIASLWFIGVATVTILGVSLTAKFQSIMTGIEVISLTALAIGALLKFSGSSVHAFSWNWFAPSGFGDFKTFMAGMLVATFYYFGWDVSSNLAEETKNSNTVPGSGGVLGMVGVFLLFLMMQCLIQMGMTDKQIADSSANLLPAFGNLIFPRPWGNIATLAVLVSTVGTIETQLTQCSRTLFSMARDRVIDSKFGEIHHRFQTPWLANFVIAIITLLLLLLSSASPNIGSLMTNLVNAIGVMVAFYYGLTGVACTWYYRKQLRKDPKTLFLKGIWPLGSAIFLLFLAANQLGQLGLTVSLLSVGAIACGILPMLFYRLKYRSYFYIEPSESFDPLSPRSVLAGEVVGVDKNRV